MKSLFLSLSILSLLTIAACNRDDTPAPVEQELITTIRLIVKDSAGTARTFDYRVQNGFGSTSPGSIRVDSVVLPASPAHFNVEVRVLNESAQPAEDITDEIIAERDDHLFIVHATAEAGSSPIAFGSGSTDNAGRPFNQTLKLGEPGRRNRCRGSVPVPNHTLVGYAGGTQLKRGLSPRKASLLFRPLCTFILTPNDSETNDGYARREGGTFFPSHRPGVRGQQR
jgi:hypothetical protein